MSTDGGPAPAVELEEEPAPATGRRGAVAGLGPLRSVLDSAGGADARARLLLAPLEILAGEAVSY